MERKEELEEQIANWLAIMRSEFTMILNQWGSETAKEHIRSVNVMAQNGFTKLEELQEELSKLD